MTSSSFKRAVPSFLMSSKRSCIAHLEYEMNQYQKCKTKKRYSPIFFLLKRCNTEHVRQSAVVGWIWTALIRDWSFAVFKVLNVKKLSPSPAFSWMALFETAVHRGLENEIAYFLRDVDSFDISRHGPEILDTVIRYGTVEMFQLLMVNPRIDITASYEYDPLILAVFEDRPDMIKLLLQDPRIKPTKDHNFALYLAIQNGFVEIFHVLMNDRRINPAGYSNKAIRAAARFGNDYVAEILLRDPRVNPAVCSNEPIRVAAEMGHYQVVELLLKDARVDPAAKENEAIRKAAKNGWDTVVELLLSHPRVKLDYDEKSFRRLFRGCDPEIMELLLEHRMHH